MRLSSTISYLELELLVFLGSAWEEPEPGIFFPGEGLGMGDSSAICSAQDSFFVGEDRAEVEGQHPASLRLTLVGLTQAA